MRDKIFGLKKDTGDLEVAQVQMAIDRADKDTLAGLYKEQGLRLVNKDVELSQSITHYKKLFVEDAQA